MMDFILRIGSLGDKPDDSPSEKLKHQFLVWMGILMCGGGLLWGSIAAYFSLFLPAVIPYGYVVLTVLNLGYFKASKNWAFVRMAQVFISLLLPFLFQWALGGFSDSGAMMLWAMLALVGSLTFSEWRSSVGWLVLYLGLAVVSGVLDPYVREAYSQNPSDGVQTAFIVTNIVVISSIVFGLTIYLNVAQERERIAAERAREEVFELNEHLEDVVEARTAELHTALSRSKAIVDNMVDGLVAINSAGFIQTANPAVWRLFALEDDMTGHSALEVLPPEIAELAGMAMAEGGDHKIEIRLPGQRTGTAVASGISDGEDITGAVVILRDVTLEKEIDRMKTDFIATVSHELRTPLTSILGFAQLTHSKLDSRVFPLVPEDDKRANKAMDQARVNFDIMKKEGARLTSLINDVLDISKMEAGRMEWKSEPVDPKMLVHRTIEATQPLLKKGVTMVPHLDETLPVLQGDRDRLLQLMINLVSNATKFTDEGEIIVCARNVDGGVELCCKDTGAGIEPAELPTIFEKFRQVGETLTDRPQGTGLGLPICRQIARAHGGDITVESGIGEGSRFYVVIPLAEEAGPEA
ncbi:MAG: hypothetical protein KC912_13850 [Proteobacteria bacterium]|nr:hypothetical protein [Pseudomonadota bacterium]